ncbi:DUF4352 domain-containing protein [Listeria fleischmannii]|uniref:DUF4352 domain-containing protein n=1 Tax=Listeria fleischmannii TaxID=1069827 RepID=UPI0002BA22EE|nr:DUF4352 domain-containing protein [Listeria fleischmannii]EMG27144.1 hypothetical protein LFLEISCH_12605 [Listeria fleischmannii subsp. fleischmannii LU2006-1]
MNIVKDDSYGQGNEKLFKIKVKMENQSKESIGAGAAPFYMKSDDGKNISYVGERNKFGQELKPKQSVEGDIYYVLDSKKKYTFVYNPSAIGISTKSMEKRF